MAENHYPVGSILPMRLGLWSFSVTSRGCIAEKFVAENGYTNTSAPLKKQLDFESFEFSTHRDELLKYRRNLLRPKAMGASKGSRGNKDGWSVAFDYQNSKLRARDICRVVTMDRDGSNIVMQHVDGIRSYFVSPK